MMVSSRLLRPLINIFFSGFSGIQNFFTYTILFKKSFSRRSLKPPRPFLKTNKSRKIRRSPADLQIINCEILSGNGCVRCLFRRCRICCWVWFRWNWWLRRRNSIFRAGGKGRRRIGALWYSFWFCCAWFGWGFRLFGFNASLPMWPRIHFLA